MKSAMILLCEDLKRHEVLVALPSNEVQLLYLIMITAKTSILKDFIETYGEKVTRTHGKIAAKIFGKEETENVYGVFLNSDMKMVFALNREFADYNSSISELVYKDIDDLLTERIEIIKQKPQQAVLMPLRQTGGGSGTLRYSLTEK